MSTPALAPLGVAGPSEDDLCAQFAESGVKPREIRSLWRWLSTLVEPASLADAVPLLERGAEWLFAGQKTIHGEPGATARLRLLLDVLGVVEPWRAGVVAVVRRVLAETRATGFFEMGLPNERGLWAETADRMARLFLPSPRDPRDLAGVVGRLLPKVKHAKWIAEAPPELWARLCGMIGGDAWDAIRQSVHDAIALVALRTSALGLSREIRSRAGTFGKPIATLPFYQLSRVGEAACGAAIAACRDRLRDVHSHLEEFGVSVDVVYRIEVIDKNLDRLEQLLALEAGGVAAGASLMSTLAAARIRERSLRDVMRTNTHLLARKIIERAGETGEHYITATRREWWKMILSAGGGGVLTCGTTAFKYLVVAGHFPLFVEGFLASTNYAISFLLMQFLGFTLASKQPSMTAAALAHALHESKPNDLDDLVTTIARICRSQLAAAVGNMGFVIPTAIIFNMIYQAKYGHAFLDEHAAEHTFESMHPTQSGTIFFASLTGVLLWLSSLCAGWLENWTVYRRIPDGIAEHRLGRIFGRGTMQWISRKFRHHIAGIGGNVSIGFLLGMVPVFGKFFGIPLEVRHITLSTGALTLAACSAGVHHASFWPAVAGIGFIGLLNFGVSFVLALTVAIRARRVEQTWFRLAGAVLLRLVRSPGEFFFPPAGAITSEHAQSRSHG
jgi:site-specific recombinase